MKPSRQIFLFPTSQESSQAKAESRQSGADDAVNNSHLLDKIQAIGKAALFKKRKTLNGEPLPQPVKRRMLV